VQFFQCHSHCTKFGNQTSALREITTSIVQGSAIGPASCIVISCDLTTTAAGNRICNYADDARVIIPACSSHSRLAELDHIDAWTDHNNLPPNCVIFVELIVSSPRRRRQFDPPPCIPNSKQVTTLIILGVTITNKLSVSEHVRTVVNSCAQILHAIRVLPCSGRRKTYVCLQLLVGLHHCIGPATPWMFSASRLSAKPLLYW